MVRSNPLNSLHLLNAVCVPGTIKFCICVCVFRREGDWERKGEERQEGLILLFYSFHVVNALSLNKCILTLFFKEIHVKQEAVNL